MATEDWVDAVKWQWGADYAQTPVAPTEGPKSFAELLRDHLIKGASDRIERGEIDRPTNSYSVQTYKLSPEQEEIEEIKIKMALNPKWPEIKAGLDKALNGLDNALKERQKADVGVKLLGGDSGLWGDGWDVESATQKLAQKIKDDRMAEEQRIEKDDYGLALGPVLADAGPARTRARAYDSTQRGNIVTNADSTVRIYRKLDSCPDLRPEWARAKYFATMGGWCEEVSYSPKGAGGGWVLLGELTLGGFPIDAYGELVEEVIAADFTVPRYPPRDAPWSKTGKADPVDRWPMGRCMLLRIEAIRFAADTPPRRSDYQWEGIQAALLDSYNQWWRARRLPSGRVAVVEALPHPTGIIVEGQFEATMVQPVPLPDLSVRGLRWTYRNTLGIRKADRDIIPGTWGKEVWGWEPL